MADFVFTEASGVADSVFGKSQAPIRMIIEDKAEAFKELDAIPKLFMTDTSNHYAEKYTGLTAMDGFMPVGENGTHPVDNMREGYSKTLEHMTWKDSFSLSREIVDDSKAIDLRKRPTAFINGYNRTRQQFAFKLFANAALGNASFTFGGKTFSAAGADELTVFHKAHPSIVEASETQSNKFSDAFGEEALAAAECAMQNFKGDNGEVLNIAPDTIVIPNNYALKKQVFAVIGADKDPATANNGFNYQFGRWNVLVSPYLSELSAQWMLVDSNYNQENGGAIWIDRTLLEIKSTVDDNTDANVWYGYARFIAGFNDWRFACVGGAADGTALI